MEISQVPTQVETPVFPTWVFQDQEEEEKDEDEEEDMNMTMEDMVRKKYAKKSQQEPLLTPVNLTQPQPELEKQKSPSPFSTYSIGKTPTPPHSPSKPTQQEDQPEKQPTKEPTPTPIESQTQQTSPLTTGPVIISNKIVFEKETLQVIPEDPQAEGEQTSSEEKKNRWRRPQKK